MDEELARLGRAALEGDAPAWLRFAAAAERASALDAFVDFVLRAKRMRTAWDALVAAAPLGVDAERVTGLALARLAALSPSTMLGRLVKAEAASAREAMRLLARAEGGASLARFALHRGAPWPRRRVALEELASVFADRLPGLPLPEALACDAERTHLGRELLALARRERIVGLLPWVNALADRSTVGLRREAEEVAKLLGAVRGAPGG